MKVYIIVQRAADRITYIGPAFSDRETAESVADTYPEEWHASVDAIDLDPFIEPYMAGISRMAPSPRSVVDARAKETRYHDL